MSVPPIVTSSRLEALIETAQRSRNAPLRTAVVWPDDEQSAGAAVRAGELGLIEPVSFGRPEYTDPAAAAAAAAALAAGGGVGALMKGSLHTDALMHAVLKEPALHTERRMSHVLIADVATYSKLLLITDAAINVAPDLEAKRDIVQNAIDLAIKLGIPCPKVAILAAVETVSSELPATLDAAALAKMADRGQILRGVVDGPLAFDDAISPIAASEKKIASSVAGDADILVVPDVEAGNMIFKELEYFAHAEIAGIVMGARIPIILTGRADGELARILSAAVAVLAAEETP